jgi:ADP-heptose:LPS heptosyltransferase
LALIGKGIREIATPVLVLRALGLGDALTGVAALRGLRRLYADRPLLLAGTEPFAGWLHRQGLVDDVIPVHDLSDRPPGRSLGPHLAVDLHGRGPQSHRLLLDGEPDGLIAFDCPEVGYCSAVHWRADEHEVDRWCRLVSAAGGQCGRQDLRLGQRETGAGPVIVHPGAASRSRRWPVDRWAEVVSALVADGLRVVLTGGLAERELCARIVRTTCGCEDLSGVQSLDELAATVAGARLVLSADTGVAHLATAYGTASVTLFGPTPPAWWGPAIDPRLHTVLHRAEPGYTGDPHGERPDPALLAISVEQVLGAAWYQLGTAPAGTSRPWT